MFAWVKLLVTILVVVWVLSFGFSISRSVVAGLGIGDALQAERSVLAERASLCGVALDEARNAVWGVQAYRQSSGAQKGSEACLRLFVP